MASAFDLFDRLMASQWANPHGPLGRLAGFLMERGNTGMNALAIEALDARPGDAVLEIGFGPGAALAELSETAGFVAGIDPSPLMIRQASKKLSPRITAGSAELLQGTSSHLPYSEARFDRALTVNTIYFWEQPPRDIREIWRVLKPGGRFVLALRALPDSQRELRVHPPFDGAPLVGDVMRWCTEGGFAAVDRRIRDVRFATRTVTGVAIIADR